MKTIRLRGKYAIGLHRYAIVDDRLYAYLNQWKWKAKPNGSGSHVYAVRDLMTTDGVMRTIRMHRVVLNYHGEFDIDHINNNALDNRFENLRVVSRTENMLNMKLHTLSGVCKCCGKSFEINKTVNVKKLHYCSVKCKEKEKNKKKLKPSKPVIKVCQHCGNDYQTLSRFPNSRFCSSGCRKKSKYIRQKQAGSLPPSSSNRRVVN